MADYTLEDTVQPARTEAPQGNIAVRIGETREATATTRYHFENEGPRDDSKDPLRVAVRSWSTLGGGVGMIVGVTQAGSLYDSLAGVANGIGPTTDAMVDLAVPLANALIAQPLAYVGMGAMIGLAVGSLRNKFDSYRNTTE